MGLVDLSTMTHPWEILNRGEALMAGEAIRCPQSRNDKILDISEQNSKDWTDSYAKSLVIAITLWKVVLWYWLRSHLWCNSRCSRAYQYVSWRFLTVHEDPEDSRRFLFFVGTCSVSTKRHDDYSSGNLHGRVFKLPLTTRTLPGCRNNSVDGAWPTVLLKHPSEYLRVLCMWMRPCIFVSLG